MAPIQKLNRLTNRFRTQSEDVTVIQPISRTKILNIKELIQYRDLIYFLVWRDIKALYAQTILGYLWAIIQPLIQIVLFTIVFGKVAKVNTDGIPYFLFSTVAIIPWNYISQALTRSSQSLVLQGHMLGKVYFPRLFFPLAPVLAKLVDFLISIVIVFAVAIYYRVTPTANLLLFPLLVLMMVMSSFAISTILAAMAIRYRDVKHALQFATRMLMYTAPIVYSASTIPEKYRIIYSINPIVGVIEGFRACFLGLPIPWMYIWPGVVATIALFFFSIVYFQRMEHVFADVI